MYIWYFKWLYACHVMGFQPEVYNLQQVQHVCPLVTILDVFVAILISHCRNMIFLFFSCHACLPEFINISTFVISNLPILAPIFCHALYGYPSLKPIYLIFEHVIIGSVDLQFERQIIFYWRYSFILEIWLWNFVWLLVQKSNTVIRAATFTPSIPHNY